MTGSYFCDDHHARNVSRAPSAPPSRLLYTVQYREPSGTYGLEACARRLTSQKPVDVVIVRWLSRRESDLIGVIARSLEEGA